MKILLIDDNEEITDLLQTTFAAKGYPCQVSNDGKEGLELIKKKVIVLSKKYLLKNRIYYDPLSKIESMYSIPRCVVILLKIETSLSRFTSSEI
jgi:CheY-like chemotaxis protein